MKTINTTIKILSIASDRDSIKLSSCLALVKSFNFKLAKSRDLNLFDSIRQQDPDIIIWILDRYESNNASIQLKIENIKNVYNIPVILVSTRPDCRYEYSTDEANYYLKWDEIAPVLSKKTILSAIEQRKCLSETVKLRRENLELISQLSTSKDLFQTIVNNTSTLVWMVDVEGNLTFLNQAWLSFIGQTLAAGLKENWQKRIHPDDLDKCHEIYQLALKKRIGFEIKYRLRRFDNKYRTILNTAVYRSNYRGEFAGWLCFGLDITRRKNIEQRFIDQSHIDGALTKIVQDIYSSLDLDTILQTAADKINQLLSAERVFITKVANNRQLNLLFESKLAAASSCEVSDPQELFTKEVEDNRELLSQGAIVALDDTLKSTIIDHSGNDFTVIPYSLLLVPVVCDRQLWGLICIDFGFSPKYWRQPEIRFLKQVATQLGTAIGQWLLYQELQQTNERLAQEVIIDDLTGIANRRQFDRYLAIEWKRCAREKHPLSLIMCDIDYFKLYNDAYGHLEGDRCLKMVAQTINRVTKRPADLVARYGGEEFAVILPNTNISGAQHIAEQIRSHVEALEIAHINSNVNDYVTLSSGVACCIPDRDFKYTALIEAADRGLYRAKGLGRNRACRFEIDELGSGNSV